MALKPAFHDTDILARMGEDRREDLGVGVLECGLN